MIQFCYPLVAIVFLEFGGFYPLFCGGTQKRTEPKSCPSCILFLGAKLVLAIGAEGALEIVAHFFPLLALLVFIKAYFISGYVFSWERILLHNVFFKEWYMIDHRRNRKRNDTNNKKDHYDG